jgi:hypothetical protein
LIGVLLAGLLLRDKQQASLRNNRGKGVHMPTFEIESDLPIEPMKLYRELLTIKGVNRELSPYIKMSAPKQWRAKPISEWPVGAFLFNSRVTLFGLIPIDSHGFKFSEVSESGFSETSKTLMNKEWNHTRSIVKTSAGSKVKDLVEYKSKLGFMGYLLMPFLLTIFKHRHSKLKAIYGINSHK